MAFTVLMPRVDVTSRSAPAAVAPRARSVGRVLVVDDEPAVLKVVTKILRGAGMDVLQANDGHEAIAIFRAHHPSIDCVLLDLNMPKLDGEETFRELKRIRSDVRVLLASGFAEQEVLDRNAGTGLVGVVQKPVKMAKLLQKVRLALAPIATGGRTATS